LQHRGPHGQGQWSAWLRTSTVFFSHRRLAIIDLSDQAAQPMTAHGFTTILNGEIYNHVELRRELEALDYRFRTSSDTEVLLAAYHRWGPACLTHLSGMFAFAIADLSNEEVFLARDPFGIKPLFYISTSSIFAFASEPALLLPFLSRRRVDRRRLEEYLRAGTADGGSGTFFEGISQLPQAHSILLSLKNWPQHDPKPQRYWRLPLHVTKKVSGEDAAAELRELVFESVRLHLRSDVPVAVAASGGVDSSSILCGVRHVLGQGAPLVTFTYEASEEKISDAPWARIAVSAAQAKAHFFRISDTQIKEDLLKLVAVQGEPFVNPAVYAQFRLFRECSRLGVRVLLEGQGADELLGGYSYFLPARVATLLSQARLLKALRLARKSPSGVFRKALAALRRNGPHSSESPFRSALRTAIENTLLPSYLRWGDRNAMAWSVENRVPFLNVRLAEFVYSLPEEFLISDDGTTKMLLRRAMKGLVPEPILNRRDKIGFATPYVTWLEELRSDLARLLAKADGFSLSPLIGGTVREAQPFLAGAPPAPRLARRLWGLLTLLLWMQVFRVSIEPDVELPRPASEKDPAPQEESVR
jgi:asparagine synthase (glutamine-hydrolysing)